MTVWIVCFKNMNKTLGNMVMSTMMTMGIATDMVMIFMITDIAKKQEVSNKMDQNCTTLQIHETSCET